MKRFTIPGLIGVLALLCSCRLQAQNHFKEQISKEFTLTADPSRSTLALYNINGTVRVRGYTGTKVVLEVTKTIRAQSAQQLELGKKEAFLGFTQRHDSIVAYMQGPFDSRPGNRRGDQRHHRHTDYDYTFDYVVKVPAQMNLHISTVNNGAVVIQDVSGSLKALNINGAVTLKNVRGTTEARTINGNVEASYLASPAGASSYSTINGDITVTYPADVSADVHFKSMHGELLTDFPEVAALPVQAIQNKQTTTSGTKYKLSKDTAVRLGKGGPDFRFETLNGDVTIKQQPK
ncbi:DUF4097 family beta strand repeat-containing protein [Hymenobacter elongatus]|uniref:Adhesin domain-containing protein n=1 Tax=Hymenobacter elongatus TaxID=877208 RepID=A0A4Z0PUE2_9BACT|nr:hypothetical protein [Hymenobacter elongatus]TGE20012.1 hypothetical protein E5J99_00135 [Hymenobacter elongatus]